MALEEKVIRGSCEGEDAMNDSRVAVRNLTDERNAAEALRAALEKMPGMDEETVRDMIEGETGLHDSLRVVLDLLLHTQVMSEGIDAKLVEFSGRKKRYEDREKYLRAAIKSMEFPDCTLTLAQRAGGLIVIDESVVPPIYWKPQDPTLDKRGLAKDLKSGTKIPGVLLGNGGVSLTINRS
jgi:hypothetical protein